MKTKSNKVQSHGTKRHKAATGDVLTPKAPPLKIEAKWREHYRHLQGLRESLLQQKGMLTRDANEEQPNYSEHMADAGTDSYDRDLALSMLSADQNALYEIDEAIRRIQIGTYGKCELTGRPIGAARLSALPWTRFSVEAEKELEQGGAMGRVHLGERISISKGRLTVEEAEEKELEEPQG